jgi:hypothetical protein
MPRRLARHLAEDLRSQLPAGAAARAGVYLSLALGAVIAFGLTALIIVFLVTALRS